MKKRIKRLAPHQNGKVAGVLMAVVTLPIYLIMALPMVIRMARVDTSELPVNIGFFIVMLFLMPIFYLVFTYLIVALGCWLYNILYKWLGGFEFEFHTEVSEGRPH